MNKLNLVLGLTFLANITLSVGLANADQFKLPEEIGRVEAPRDTNVFQIEPTVLNERYYISGADERHQFIGNTLPEGAPIPDTDYPVPVSVSVGTGARNQIVAPAGVGSTTITAPAVVPTITAPRQTVPSNK
jgi:hypothetical protein